jgi:membrane-associated phospholipid phosphatase
VDSRARSLLYGAAACAALFGVILVLAYWVHGARELDFKALDGFVGLQRSWVDGLTLRIAHLGDPAEVGLIGLLLAGIALLRGRPRIALAVIVLLAATSVSSQALKALFAYPRVEGHIGLAQVQPEAFPSGHSTAAMTLAIACVMVVPPGMRRLAAVVGGGLALSVGLSVVIRGSHFPSEVAGGFLLATGWGLGIAAALRLAELRWPERTGRGQLADGVGIAVEVFTAAGLTALAGCGALLLVVAVVAELATGGLMDFVRGHTAALLVGTGLLVLALGLLAGFVIGLRQREQG